MDMEQGRAQRLSENDDPDPVAQQGGTAEGGPSRNCFAKRVSIYGATLPGVSGMRGAYGMAKVTGDTVGQALRISTTVPRLALEHVSRQIVGSEVEQSPEAAASEAPPQ